VIGNDRVLQTFRKGGVIQPISNQIAVTFDGINDIGYSSDAGVTGIPVSTGFTMACAVKSPGPPGANEIFLGWGNTGVATQYCFLDVVAGTNAIRMAQRFGGGNNVHATALIMPTNQWCVVVASVWDAGGTNSEVTLYNLETGAIATAASGAMAAYGADNLNRFAVGAVWASAGQALWWLGDMGYAALWARRMVLAEQATVARNYCDLDHSLPDCWWNFGDWTPARWRGGLSLSWPTSWNIATGGATLESLRLSNMAANDIVFDRQIG
jgi:hypothetical protein